MAFVTFDRVTRRYDAHVIALNGVSVEIERGEWIAVMGPSGSGKTTLMNILGGLDLPDEGRVLVDGVEITRASRKDLIRYRREKVGLVFQQFHLVPYLNAIENVMLAQYLHSMADEPEAEAALREVGLGDRLHHLPSQLSGGEKQRVCIARALINEPGLVLADEPTGNLDEENERIVMELFTKMHERGQTIVMVTHDPVIGARADRQIQLEHGRLAGYHLTDAQGSEEIDEVLEYLYLEQEGHRIPPEVCARGALLSKTALIDHVARKGLVVRNGNGARFTEEGAERARLLVRRHRLAEKLFTDRFKMEDGRVEQEACYFEHRLSSEMTDAICAFLGHPRLCPHGHAIPPGTCCAPGDAPAS